MKRISLGALITILAGGFAALNVSPHESNAQTARPSEVLECKEGVQFVPRARPKRRLVRTEPIQRATNKGRRGNIRFMFTAEKARTVKQEVSAGGEVSANAVFAEAKATFNYSFAKETTTRIGNFVDGQVRPRSRVIGRYGVNVYNLTGFYYSEKGKGFPATSNCKYKSEFFVKTSIPLDEAEWVVSRQRLDR